MTTFNEPRVPITYTTDDGITRLSYVSQTLATYLAVRGVVTTLPGYVPAEPACCEDPAACTHAPADADDPDDERAFDPMLDTPIELLHTVPARRFHDEP